MDPYLGSLRRECSKGMKGVSKVNESLALLASMANNDLTRSGPITIKPSYWD